MTAMQLEIGQQDGIFVITMSGDLEVQEIDEVKSALDEALKKSPRPAAVLEVSQVTRLTSYVVALIGFYNAQFKGAKGKLVIAGASSAARRSFELSGLASVLTLAEGLGKALEMLKT